MNDKTINVLLIIGSLGDGGKERQLVLLLKALKQHKHIKTSLMVMNSGGEREEEARKVVDKIVILTGQRNLNLIKPLRRMKQLIKQNEIDIIHTWGSGLWDLMGVIAGRLCHKPVIHNGIQSVATNLNFYNMLTRFGALFADVIVANSVSGLKSFKLIDLPKSRVIHNGLDTSRFECVQVFDEGHNLCMVANFLSAKDQQSLVLAMPDIVKIFPDTKLYLIGHDYGNLNVIECLVNNLQLNNSIYIITNCIYPEPIISICQIGILATHGEGISNAILEYMALSKPVIASRCPGNEEVVIDNVTGFIVEPRLPDAISQKVFYLFKNPEIAKRMGERGKEIVNDKFSLAKMEIEYLRLYQELRQKS